MKQYSISAILRSAINIDKTILVNFSKNVFSPAWSLKLTHYGNVKKRHDRNITRNDGRSLNCGTGVLHGALSYYLLIYNVQCISFILIV